MNMDVSNDISGQLDASFEAMRTQTTNDMVDNMQTDMSQQVTADATFDAALADTAVDDVSQVQEEAGSAAVGEVATNMANDIQTPQINDTDVGTTAKKVDSAASNANAAMDMYDQANAETDDLSSVENVSDMFKELDVNNSMNDTSPQPLPSQAQRQARSIGIGVGGDLLPPPDDGVGGAGNPPPPDETHGVDEFIRDPLRPRAINQHDYGEFIYGISELYNGLDAMNDDVVGSGLAEPGSGGVVHELQGAMHGLQDLQQLDFAGMQIGEGRNAQPGFMVPYNEIIGAQQVLGDVRDGIWNLFDNNFDAHAVNAAFLEARDPDYDYLAIEDPNILQQGVHMLHTSQDMTELLNSWLYGNNGGAYNATGATGP